MWIYLSVGCCLCFHHDVRLYIGPYGPLCTLKVSRSSPRDHPVDDGVREDTGLLCRQLRALSHLLLTPLSAAERRDRNMVWWVIAPVLALAPSPPFSRLLNQSLSYSCILLLLFGLWLTPLSRYSLAFSISCLHLWRSLNYVVYMIRAPPLLPHLPVTPTSSLTPGLMAAGCSVVQMKMPDEELIVSLPKMCLDHPY